MSIGIQFGGPDTASISFLAGWPYGLFIYPRLNNGDLRLQEFLRITYLEDGSPLLLGEPAYDIQAFRDLTGRDLAVVPNSAIHQIFFHWVQRVRNYGYIESLATFLATARIPRADRLTPTNCIGHCGRLINVIDAAQRIAWLKTLTPERYDVLAYGVDFGFPPYNLLCTCSLEGIIPGVDDDYERPRRPFGALTKWDRFAHIWHILSKRSPGEMTEDKFSDLLELMLRVSDELLDNPDPRSKLERLIGEAFMARGRHSEAIEHFEKALSLRPKVGVKKLLEKLKTERDHAAILCCIE